jgi:hypothetical protein
MKKQIALALAGTAAVVAGGLRSIKDLVHRDEAHSRGAGPAPEKQAVPTAPPAPSSTVPDPASPPRPAPAGRDLAGASKAELYGMATEMKIAGRSKMGKAELIRAIEAAS